MAEEEKPILFVRRASGLIRELGMLDITTLCVAITIGAGVLYFAVEAPTAFPGANIPLAYVIGGLIVLVCMFTVGLMTAAAPRSGGIYVPTSRVLGPAIGAFAGWAMFVTLAIVLGIVANVAIIAIGTTCMVAGLTGAGQILLSTWGMFGFAVLLIIIGVIVSLFGIKATKTLLLILVVLPFAAFIISGIYLVAVGPAFVKAHFDATWGAGAFQGVIDAAHEAGWTTPEFSWEATVSALLAVLWAYHGPEGISFLGGEMKTMGKKIALSFVVGTLIVMTVYLLTVGAVYYAYGEFVGCYSFAATHPEILEGIMPAIKPSIPFYVISVMPKGVGIALSLLMALWPVNSVFVIMLGASRCLFAMSFDRALPEKLSDVNRFGAPTWSIIITTIVGIASAYMFHSPVAAVMGVLLAVNAVPIMLFGLATAALPFIREDLLHLIPMGGRVSTAALGTWVFCYGWFMLFLSGMELTLPMAYFAIALFGIGVIIYLWQQNKNVKKGIDISKIYAEIPP